MNCAPGSTSTSRKTGNIAAPGRSSSILHMYLETESARSAVYYAAVALQEGAADASAAVTIAKLYASDACRTVGNRGIQIHGGMGFTWEHDLHLYYRRAKASETMLGDATFHRERLARLVVDAGAKTARALDPFNAAPCG